MRLIWKDYPESDTKSKSWQAAVAARCAHEQGKFWQYHDLLYKQSNDNIGKDLLVDLAKSINLRLNLFSECLEDERAAQLIKDNIIEAQALDINGIPYIFVNNQEILGEISFEDLVRIVEVELSGS